MQNSKLSLTALILAIAMMGIGEVCLAQDIKVSGAGTGTVDGNYTLDGSVAGKPRFRHDVNTTKVVQIDGGEWIIGDDGGALVTYYTSGSSLPCLRQPAGRRKAVRLLPQRYQATTCTIHWPDPTRWVAAGRLTSRQSPMRSII